MPKREIILGTKVVTVSKAVIGEAEKLVIEGHSGIGKGTLLSNPIGNGLLIYKLQN